MSGDPIDPRYNGLRYWDNAVEDEPEPAQEMCGLKLSDLRRCMRVRCHRGRCLDTLDAHWRPGMEVTSDPNSRPVSGDFAEDGPANDVPPVVENTGGLRASSGEAAGDGVTHQQAWGIAVRLKWSQGFEILNRYIAQREAAEREAAELRQQLERTKETLSAVLEDEAELEKDRDAERAQKEALRMTLEEMVTSRQASLSILSEEFPKLGAQWRSCLAFVFGALGAADLYKQLLDEYPQPAEAAPVAKEEAPSEPDCTCPKIGPKSPSSGPGKPGAKTAILVGHQPGCPWHAWRRDQAEARRNAHEAAGGKLDWAGDPIAEAPSEPVAWVTKCEPCGGDGFTGHSWGSNETCQTCGGLGHVPVEPAPRPPATTGADGLLGPVDGLRAEIVAALQQMANADCFSPHTADQIRALAYGLERRTK